MKVLVSFLLFLCFGIASGQTFSYPNIKQEGRKIADFIPNGWEILKISEGDLNKDLQNDCALVIQHRDSVKIKRAEESINEIVTIQPRMLLILFRDKMTNGFKLREKSETFILCHDTPQMDDPFDSLYIEKGILNIKFRLFYWIGSWDVNQTTYKFRYQNNEFVLIGAENTICNRSTLDFEEYSYNFLTKRWSLTKWNNESKQTPVPEWYKLDLNELKTLKTIYRPYRWEVTKDIFL